LVRSAPGLAMLEEAERASNIDTPASSYANHEEGRPNCGENPDPAEFTGELDPTARK